MTTAGFIAMAAIIYTGALIFELALCKSARIADDQAEESKRREKVN